MSVLQRTEDWADAYCAYYFWRGVTAERAARASEYDAALLTAIRQDHSRGIVLSPLVNQTTDAAARLRAWADEVSEP